MKFKTISVLIALLFVLGGYSFEKTIPEEINPSCSLSEPEEVFEEPVSSEPERPELSYTDSENTYIFTKSNPDFDEVFPDKYINIVNDRLYAASSAWEYGILSADFDGKNGISLENYFFESYPGDTQQEPANICSAGGTDIFVLEQIVPKEKPWEVWQAAVKTDAEGNYIEHYPLAEIENGIPFGYYIAFDKSGNFYLWTYWGKVLVFRNNFTESYLIDLSADLTFEKLAVLNNGTAVITASNNESFVFDHENQTLGKKIEIPLLNIFENSGNAEFDFLCSDYENIYGYNFEENCLEKLFCFADYEINPDLLHSADIDENGNITVITKEIIWCEPTVYELFYFEKES